MNEPSEPFGAVLADLLRERGYVTGSYGINWTGFVQELPDVSQETLRKAVAEDRPPSAKLMKTVAKALDVDPAESFREYRLQMALGDFDPKQVGEAAYENADVWLHRMKRQRAET